MSNPSYQECKSLFSTMDKLCKRFGTSFLAPDRDAIIKSGVQRVLDREKWLEDELARVKEGK